MTADSEAEIAAIATEDVDEPAPPRLVLCAVDEALAQAWDAAIATAAPGRASSTANPAHRATISVHRGSVLDVPAQVVVSPTNSFGLMRNGIDAVYAERFPSIEQHVRSAVLAYHGGELPVGQAVIVPTGNPLGVPPMWLIGAPTMREPGERLPPDTVHPYLAARAVFRLWREGRLEDETPVRRVVQTIALPGLGTGVGGVDPMTCARQVMAAWDEVFGPPTRPA